MSGSKPLRDNDAVATGPGETGTAFAFAPNQNGMRELIVPVGSAAHVIRYIVEADDMLILRISTASTTAGLYRHSRR